MKTKVSVSTGVMKSDTRLELIDPDLVSENHRVPENCVVRCDVDGGAEGVEKFLIVRGSTLAERSDFVEKVVQHVGKMRMLIVLLDMDVNLVFDAFTHKPWKQFLPILFFAKDFNEVERILQAWDDRLPNERIASANVKPGGKLAVKSCSLKSYEIEFSQLKSLAQIKEDDRSKFEIDEFGRHLYWPDYDIHIDIIDAIRYQKDETYRKNRDLQDFASNKNCGEAIAKVREMHNLSQKKIEDTVGLAERHLRRIEKEGFSLTLDAAEKLAEAHGVDLAVYLQMVAKASYELRAKKRR